MRLGKFGAKPSDIIHKLERFIFLSALFSKSKTLFQKFIFISRTFKGISSNKIKKKKLEREQNVNIKYKIFKYQKHYSNVKIIIRRKEKQSPYFLLQNFISKPLLFNKIR